MNERRKNPMKGVLVVLAVVGLVMAFAGTLFFLYQRSEKPEEAARTEQPKVTDIVRKAVATGSIVPRREILIKPRVSGIIKAIYVEPGDIVEEGTLIAEIKIVPNMGALTDAESAVRSARIAVKHAEAELARAERLAGDGLISSRELSDHKLEFDLRKAELSAAAQALQVVREGAVATADDSANTRVRSTVAGTVLEVPVEEGASVIESNTFNEGTTVATVADMGDMIFLGYVDEADVDKIRVGMDVVIRIGAIDSHEFDAKLEYIAPKGLDVEGAIQFEIKAAVKPKNDVVIRAGYSANAEIVLERKEKVLAVSEALLQFEGDIPYVEVQVGTGRFERRDLEVGISDGIHIEVKSGVDEDAVIKHPEPPEG